MCLDAFRDDIQRDQIISALGDDDIGVSLAGFHKHLVHGLDRGEILIDNALQISASVSHIANDSTQDTHICISVYEDFDIHLVAEFFVLENEDTFNDDDLRGADGFRFGQPVVDGKIVNRAGDAVTGFQLPQGINEHVGVECVGVIVIQLAAILKAHAVVLFVVVIVVDDGYIVAKTVNQLLRNGRLAAAGASGDTDDYDVAHGVYPLAIE